MGHGHYGNLSQSIRRTFWRPRSSPSFRGCSATSSWGSWSDFPPQHAVRPPIGPSTTYFGNSRFAPRASSHLSYRANFPALCPQPRAYSSGITHFDDPDMKRSHDGSYSANRQTSQSRHRSNDTEESESSRKEKCSFHGPDLTWNRYGGGYAMMAPGPNAYQQSYPGQNPCYQYSARSWFRHPRMTDNYASVNSNSERSEHFRGENEKDLLELISNARRWEYTRFGKEHKANPGPGLSFTVMCYNILAQELLIQNWRLYESSPEFALSWEYRKEHLIREMEQTKADIICLQEVEKDAYFLDLLPVLTRWGYQGRYKQRTGGKCDGCAIFFNEDVFQLERWEDVEYRRQKGKGILNRDNIAVIMVLKPRDKRMSDSKVCVATTHLLFNPGRGDIKLAQVRLLLAELDKFAFRGMKDAHTALYHPVILCGDMNSEPHCSIYNFLSSGHLTYEGLMAGRISGQKEGLRKGKFVLEKQLIPAEIGVSDQCQYMDLYMKRLQELSFQASEDIDTNCPVVVVDQGFPRIYDSSFASGSMSHGLNLVSAYDHDPCKEGDDKGVTTHHSKATCTVDYIFYSVDAKVSTVGNRGDVVVHKGVKEGDLKLLATYKLFCAKDMQKLGGLPNAALPSDHLSLVAEFLLQG